MFYGVLVSQEIQDEILLTLQRNILRIAKSVFTDEINTSKPQEIYLSTGKDTAITVNYEHDLNTLQFIKFKYNTADTVFDLEDPHNNILQYTNLCTILVSLLKKDHYFCDAYKHIMQDSDLNANLSLVNIVASKWLDLLENSNINIDSPEYKAIKKTKLFKITLDKAAKGEDLSFIVDNANLKKYCDIASSYDVDDDYYTEIVSYACKVEYNDTLTHQSSLENKILSGFKDYHADFVLFLLKNLAEVKNINNLNTTTIAIKILQHNFSDLPEVIKFIDKLAASYFSDTDKQKLSQVCWQINSSSLDDKACQTLNAILFQALDPKKYSNCLAICNYFLELKKDKNLHAELTAIFLDLALTSGLALNDFEDILEKLRILYPKHQSQHNLDILRPYITELLKNFMTLQQEYKYDEFILALQFLLDKQSHPEIKNMAQYESKSWFLPVDSDYPLQDYNYVVNKFNMCLWLSLWLAIFGTIGLGLGLMFLYKMAVLPIAVFLVLVSIATLAISLYLFVSTLQHPPAPPELVSNTLMTAVKEQYSLFSSSNKQGHENVETKGSKP
jgi:hypothetical protein